MYPREPDGWVYFELVVVDDGSSQSARAVLDHLDPNFPVICHELPAKKAYKNPCLPINLAVSMSTGDALLLTSPEVTHDTDILWKMWTTVQEDPMSYVFCNVHSPHDNMWYIKDRSRPPYPFCAMLSRTLWDKTWVLAIIIGLLAAEWILRKRARLV